MTTFSLLGMTGALALTLGCAPSAPAPTSTVKKTLAPVQVGQQKLAANSIYNGMPDDSLLIFEHRRNSRSLPSRPLRQLSEEEADKWMSEVVGINKNFFNVMPRFSPREALRKAGVASMDELRELIVSSDAEVQRVGISEAVLREDPMAVFALAEVESRDAIHAMWRFRGFEEGQNILRSWKDSSSEKRRQAACLYLGTTGDPSVKKELVKMADIELRNVIPRSGPGAYQRRHNLNEADWPASARHILATHYFSTDAPQLRRLRLEPTFLIGIDTVEARKVMHESASSLDFYERKSLMTVLGEAAAHPQQIPTLIKGINDEEAQVRIEAAKALAKVGDKSVVPALRKALENPPPPKSGSGRHHIALGQILLAIDALGGSVSADEAEQIKSMKSFPNSYR